MLRATPIADGAAVSATTSYPFTADSHRVVSVQASWTVTTASFTVTLQMSLDGSTWEDFTTGTAVTATGSVLWQIETKDALYWRVQATKTSGSLDSLTAHVANVPR